MAVNSAFHFGLEEAWISQWLGVETYGTAQQLISCEIFNVSFDTVSGQLRGDDVISDVHARTISAKIKIKFGFNRLGVLSIFSGETVTSSTTAESIVLTNTDRPYFAIAGRVDATQLGGDLQIFLPKVKITGSIALNAQFGAYLTPELEALAIREGATYGIGRLIKHNTATSVTIPIS